MFYKNILQATYSDYITHVESAEKCQKCTLQSFVAYRCHCKMVLHFPLASAEDVHLGDLFLWLRCRWFSCYFNKTLKTFYLWKPLVMHFKNMSKFSAVNYTACAQTSTQNHYRLSQNNCRSPVFVFQSKVEEKLL